MKSNSWNISNLEGANLLENLLLDILHHNSKLTIGEIGSKLKEKALRQKLVFIKDGKKRNINQYIRKEFDGIYNFVKNNNKLDVIPLIDYKNQYYVMLTDKYRDELNKINAENDDFVWISSDDF